MQATDLSVSIHPYIHSPLSKSAIFFHRALALLPVFIIAIYNYGLMALATMAAALAAALVPAYLALRSRGRRFADIEHENYYYAMLFAVALPAGVPAYAAALGAFILYMLTFSRSAGASMRVFNPVAVAVAAMTVSFQEQMLFFNAPRPFLSKGWLWPLPAADHFDGFMAAARPAIAEHGPTALHSLFKLLSGWYPGHFCETSMIIVMIGGAYMSYKRSVDLMPFGGAVAGLFATVCAFCWRQGFWGVTTEFALYAFGSLFLFYSLFMLSDYYSSPETRFARLFYGVAFGSFCYLFGHYSGGMDRTNFALLVCCALVPLLDTAAEKRRVD